jgi:hypothetical protein
MEWKHTSLHRAKQFKSVPSAGKVILILFWGFNGSILKHYQDHGQIVNTAQYWAMLEEEFKPTVHSKYKRMLVIVLHNENA